MDLLIYGATLNFRGSDLKIHKTIAIGNTGLKGGFLLIEKQSSQNPNIWIHNSLFTKNRARNGPGFYIGENVEKFKLVVTNNYFYDNSGWGKLKI